MHRRTSFVVPAFALAAGLVFAACESSSNTSACGSGTPPSLVGTYDLVSAMFGPQTYGPPDYSGSLVFTSTRYKFTVLQQDVTVLADSGTYTVTGSKCIGENSDTGLPQFSGTFALSGTAPGATLTVTGAAATVSVTFVATKQ